MLALYHLRFFELDQSIAVGERKNFSFFTDPYFSEVTSLDFVPEGMLLVFYNSLGYDKKKLVLDCTVRRIHHLEIGEVREINTNGFDYCIETLTDTIRVDAEEQAGEVWEGGSQPSGWLFTVEVEVHNVVSLD